MQAVRLPKTDLDAIRRNGLDSSRFHQLTAPMRELARGGVDAKADNQALHDSVLNLAAEATGTRVGEEAGYELNPEWVAEIVFPTAQALMYREQLENHPDERRSAAFEELTGLFRGKVEGLESAPRRG